MSDPASGLTSGGDNNLDGDYYKARWAETGVIEADCLLCHMPGYDYGQRKKQLSSWNFRWAATAGAKLAEVTGSVQHNEPPEVVYNTVPKIDSPGKRLWTFYGPDWEFRNHYGYLNMMGYDDKPTERFRPKLVRYQGKIYPVNQIHSAWPGIEIEAQQALMQPKMSDVVKMWTSHRADPENKYPQLATIVDDTGNGVPEVNRPEEIDALIASVAQMLADIEYPMEGKRVVWVMDDRVYWSGTEYRVMDKRSWETSPFANVHKYSHDIYPAKAALGAGGCTDCHSPGAEFFYAPVLTHLFDETGKPVVELQHQRLGLSWNAVTLTACCQFYVKPMLYSLMMFFPSALVALVGGSAVHWVFGQRRIPFAVHFIPLIVATAAVIGTVMLLYQPDLLEYMLPTRMWLDANRFLIAVGVMLAGLVALLWQLRQWLSDTGQHRSLLGAVIGLLLLVGLVLATVAGVLVFLKLPGLDTVTRASHSVLDASVTLLMLDVLVTVVHRVVQQFRE